MHDHPVAVADLGGTHISTGMVTVATASVTDHIRTPLDSAAGAAEILDVIADSLRPLDLSRGLGIAAPGPFDYARGIALYEGVAKFESLHGRDLRAELAARLHISSEAVTFMKDADAYALGELAAGSGGDARTVVLLTLGTGIGSSFLRDGAPEIAPPVPALGDVYPLEFAGRRLEEYVSSRAIRRSFGASTGQQREVKEIATLARGGDHRAQHVLDEAMTWLARIVGPSLRSFGATRVILGGSISASSDLLIPAFVTQLAADGNEAPEVVPGQLFDLAPLVGAAEIVVRSHISRVDS